MNMKYFLLLFLAFFIVDKSFGQSTNCNTATPITIPSSGVVCVNGTIVGTNTNGFYSLCETPGSYHVWYTFISPGGADTVTVSPRGGTPASNLVVTMTSTNCASNNYDVCNAAATPTGSAMVVRNTPIYHAGTQVWVYI